MANISSGLNPQQLVAAGVRAAPPPPSLGNMGTPGAGMQAQYPAQYAAWQAQLGTPNAIHPNNFLGYLQQTGALGTPQWGTVAGPNGTITPPAGSGYVNGSYGNLTGAPQPDAAQSGQNITDRNGLQPLAGSRTSTPFGTGTPVADSFPSVNTAPGDASAGFGWQPGSQTLGGMAGGTNAVPQSIPNQNAPNYPLNVGAYLNPMADYMQQQALKNIQSTYAGAGNLLSGPAMKGISDYSQNMALGNAFQPALAAAQQQQGFGYGVNAADRNFAFQQQLANQTIPFSQQMQLAQLGLQGTQGQQSVANLLATLLSQNALGAGQAAGTGTIGGANAINNAISQALSQYLSQNMLNRVFPQTAPTGTG